MATLTLRGVCKTRHGRQQVLRDIDLDVADGEFVVLVGPSGCGKSTLLRMTTGLESITSSDIRIGSRIVNQVEAMTLAQRIVVLNQDCIEQIGTPEQIYERPQSTFVASFMGAPAMNLLHGRLSDDRLHFHVNDGPRISIAGA
ncbi:hypothetical protein GCM10011400_38460 [Paraburkholderia caffeinilytica]|uniref:ABC transporter domain-containing protein n=1 Tax=Paraburkholderia caffeinilytica TaxID=1761016 RepID=A0ABQ1MYR4_9BURK|nr:hypothetical protein GCM10011400_38460 [Paraburkholderia caffeinilytica]CAB3782921.1 Vitamin B12 import ATP-binding protein BtuD [Paraburkholderia caffeinilytica]